MSRRSDKWRARFHGRVEIPAPKTQLEFHLAQLQARWNQILPKCARQIHRVGEHIRYLHPTKGWRVIHKRRFFGADALLPA